MTMFAQDSKTQQMTVAPSHTLLHSLKFVTHPSLYERDVLMSLFGHVMMASGSWWYSEEIAQRFKELED